MKTDIEIAAACKMKPIVEIAAMLGIAPDEIECYGKYKAKLSNELGERLKQRKNGKLVLVTAINPTPAGEGKTTTTVGLGQALCKVGKRAILALREPSLGPVFGLKGGAAGGGYAQVVPMDEINLHFTGDLHAITSAHNLLSAMIDNHIHQGNELGIDVRKVTWKRALDMNDRALRNIVVGLGTEKDGVPRQDGFMITVASEIMAILCLAEDLADLKRRISKIIIGYNFAGDPVTAGDLGATGAMALLLKDALKPNLVQTLENTPCLIHGGPFANIAHGCNSVRATKMALKLADYCITEAGFGADLGGEKFLDIKCRNIGVHPDAILVVATIRALKYNGGVEKENLKQENVEALRRGLPNLEKHIENMKSVGAPVIVAVNRFDTDTDEEIRTIIEFCDSLGVDCVMSEVFAKGGAGGVELAKKLVEVTDHSTSTFQPFYELDQPVEKKIEDIVKKVYGGKGINILPPAKAAIAKIEKLGYGKLPICMAKTQYSLSDNPNLLGRPQDFEVTVKEVRLCAGAGFIVVLTGDIMTMPGLPKRPAALNMDISDDGVITGLF